MQLEHSVFSIGISKQLSNFVVSEFRILSNLFMKAFFIKKIMQFMLQKFTGRIVQFFVDILF